MWSPNSTLETCSIVISLVLIVLVSVIAGALLPLLLQYCGADSAHASTTIQVVMDISGVAITMLVTTMVVDCDFTQEFSRSFA